MNNTVQRDTAVECSDNQHTVCSTYIFIAIENKIEQLAVISGEYRALRLADRVSTGALGWQTGGELRHVVFGRFLHFGCDGALDT